MARGNPRLRPRRRPAEAHLRRRRERRVRARRGARRRLPGRESRRPRRRLQDRRRQPAEGPAAPRGSVSRAVPGAPREAHGARAEAVRRSAERRHRRRHRTGLPRGLRVHRARQALHRAGLRHRPGQAGQHQRPGDRRAGPGQEHRRHRHHHVPSELHPGDLRRRRRPPLRAPVRTGALHRPARLAREERRRVRRRRPVEAAVVLPAPGRGHARRRGPRMPRSARGGRPARRLDPGQDRHPGPGRAGVPQPGLHQRLDQARRRQGALRPDVQGRRDGLRRRRDRLPGRQPLRHDHHHRRRRPRTGVAGAVPPEPNGRS
ncbi:hypothetical protein PA7078_00757 [Pseudomonas aeruginosa]